MKRIKRWFVTLFATLFCVFSLPACVLPQLGNVGASDTSAVVGTYELSGLWSEGVEANIGNATNVWGNNLIIKRTAVTLTLTDRKFELCFNEPLLFGYDKLTFNGKYTLSDNAIRLRYTSVEIVDGYSTMKQFQLFPVDLSKVMTITVQGEQLIMCDTENDLRFTLTKVQQ